MHRTHTKMNIKRLWKRELLEDLGLDHGKTSEKENLGRAELERSDTGKKWVDATNFYETSRENE